MCIETKIIIKDKELCTQEMKKKKKKDFEVREPI